ncbi:MAG: fumarylacetoacetate hydrolase family protein [Thiobacillaceae bacterium]|nr:fumarylacetoacetate hydrolase family protein [Thiobacillaceae bacterium]
MTETWLRFEHGGRIGFGRLQEGDIHIHHGDLFGQQRPSQERLPLHAVRLLPPCQPGKFIGLWNNFAERAAYEGLSMPAHPLYFFKADSCVIAHGQSIRQPASYSGPVVFEGELGVVIGRPCRMIEASQADDYIFGYTCVNDVTARGILKSDPSFVQWSRAKGFDTFGPIGPWIVRGIDPDGLRVRTLVNGAVKQDYPVADMFYRPREIVALLSRDMTLMPGDVIACGTSLGADALNPGDTVEIDIEGIGRLSNRFA